MFLASLGSKVRQVWLEPLGHGARPELRELQAWTVPRVPRATEESLVKLATKEPKEHSVLREIRGPLACLGTRDLQDPMDPRDPLATVVSLETTATMDRREHRERRERREPKAHQEWMVLMVSMVHLVPLADEVTGERQETRVHRVHLDRMESQAYPECRVHLDQGELLVHMGLLVPTATLVSLERRAPGEMMEKTVSQDLSDPLASLASLESLEPRESGVFPEILANLVILEYLAFLVALDRVETRVVGVALVLKVPEAPRDCRDPKEGLDSPETSDQVEGVASLVGKVQLAELVTQVYKA